MPETDGAIFGDGEYYPLPGCVYFKSGSGWRQGEAWNGVLTLREGSKFVTIQFNGNGGAVRTSSRRVLSGNLWGKMQTPIRNGQMFVGWYTSASGGSLITASSEVPARDTTYYAHWAPILSLGASADGSGFNWSSDSWHGQSVETHDGTDACRSGSICDNGSTYLQTTVDGPGTISFWWKVSCEGGGHDALRFLVDGSQREMITGESGWRYVSVSVTGNGTHRLKWNYTKDGSVTKGQDCGWIDQVQWSDNKVRIYFNGNGGSVRSGSTRALPGNLWGKMQTPVRYGYMFVGWYTSPSGGSLVNASSAVPSYSTTYYAHWTPILSLGASGDTSLPLSSDSWHGQNVDTHDGTDAIRSGSICDGQSTWLKTTVSGAGTLSFWWRVSCEGTGHDALRLLVDGQQREMITGEIGWTHVSVPVYDSGTHEIKWNYTKNSSVTKGQDCGWVDQIQWESGLPLDVMSMAMDTDCTFESSGNADWTVWGTDAYYGSSCLKSGSVSDGQSSVVRTSYYSMGGYVYFYWKVSSESGWDKLHFYVDNSEVGTAISGETSWQLQNTYLSVGWHTLEWRYTKDGSYSSGQDCGWIDWLH